jgi:hypothetical protein
MISNGNGGKGDVNKMERALNDPSCIIVLEGYVNWKYTPFFFGEWGILFWFIPDGVMGGLYTFTEPTSSRATRD